MSRPNNNDENYQSGITLFGSWRPWLLAKLEEGWDYSEELKDKEFEYVKDTPSDTWNIQHNLGKRPSVTVIDSAGTEVEGNVQHIDENNLTITFSAAFSGKAYLN